MTYVEILSVENAIFDSISDTFTNKMLLVMFRLRGSIDTTESSLQSLMD